VTRDLSEVLTLVVSLATSVGRLQLDQRHQVTEIQTKAHANDLVSQVDFASEKLIVDAVIGAFPGDSILGEEGSDITGHNDWQWVVDPLDGTLNYLTGAGPWSVSIALQHQQQTVLAVVHDPAVGETFTAIAGQGAQLNNRPIHVSTDVPLAKSIIGFSFNPSLSTRQRLGPLLADLLPVIGDIRRVPSALGLSYLAAGRFDGSFILNTKPWDIAASEMIAREAGARASSSSGVINEMAIFADPALLADLVGVVSPDHGAFGGLTS
jgi:myo-inositol-1(or 4)-monophosphatase